MINPEPMSNTVFNLEWLRIGTFRESPGRLGIGELPYADRSISVETPATVASKSSNTLGLGSGVGLGFGVGVGVMVGDGVGEGDGVGVGVTVGLGLGEGQALVIEISLEPISSLP